MSVTSNQIVAMRVNSVVFHWSLFSVSACVPSVQGTSIGVYTSVACMSKVSFNSIDLLQ